MKQMEVSIMGQSYVLGCPEGGEGRLLEAVSRLDHEMTQIRDAGKVKSRERIAVLAALNLAFELSASMPAASPAPATTATPDEAQLDTWIARIDRCLEQDGQLL
ncbi:MAG: cell division protein ZapA [Burkholderiaceae bacterium]|nr:MAG: cell division protein ZapA [Burkholderiaceae bacterium]